MRKNVRSSLYVVSRPGSANKHASFIPVSDILTNSFLLIVNPLNIKSQIHHTTRKVNACYRHNGFCHTTVLCFTGRPVVRQASLVYCSLVGRQLVTGEKGCVRQYPGRRRTIFCCTTKSVVSETTVKIMYLGPLSARGKVVWSRQNPSCLRQA